MTDAAFDPGIHDNTHLKRYERAVGGAAVYSTYAAYLAFDLSRNL